MPPQVARNPMNMLSQAAKLQLASLPAFLLSLKPLFLSAFIDPEPQPTEHEPKHVQTPDHLPAKGLTFLHLYLQLARQT